jgi:hypothetical protein
VVVTGPVSEEGTPVLKIVEDVKLFTSELVGTTGPVLFPSVLLESEDKTEVETEIEDPVTRGVEVLLDNVEVFVTTEVMTTVLSMIEVVTGCEEEMGAVTGGDEPVEGMVSVPEWHGEVDPIEALALPEDEILVANRGPRPLGR